MILETKAAAVAVPAAAKILISAGQLLFAGFFLAIGFQTGHGISRKFLEWYDARSYAKIEREAMELEEGHDTRPVSNGDG